MTRSQKRTVFAAVAGIAGVIALACASTPRDDPDPDTQQGLQMTMSQRKQAMKTLPGITVLLRDSLELLENKRVGLLTNQTGIDENGVSDADLLVEASKKGKAPGMKLVMLFSPEHGIRGTEDHTNVAGGVDKSTGLPIISLYGNNVLPPPDSALDQIDALVIDLQDIGARPWTYPASVVYAMRAAAQHHVMVLVLDRPNPINGQDVEGPVLDSALAWAGSQSPERSAQPTALYPIPLRHGMTMGELAKLYNSELQLGADLHVIPMANWRRSRWFDRTGLPWVNPSPNMTSLAAATLYPGLVILEPSNVSVGRGTPIPFQWVGAPWMNAKKVINVLDDFTHPGREILRRDRDAGEAHGLPLQREDDEGHPHHGHRSQRAADVAARRVDRVRDQEDAPGLVQGRFGGVRAHVRGAGARQAAQGARPRPDHRLVARGDGRVQAQDEALPHLSIARRASGCSAHRGRIS